MISIPQQMKVLRQTDGNSVKWFKICITCLRKTNTEWLFERSRDYFDHLTEYHTVIDWKFDKVFSLLPYLRRNMNRIDAHHDYDQLTEAFKQHQTAQAKKIEMSYKEKGGYHPPDLSALTKEMIIVDKRPEVDINELELVHYDNIDKQLLPECRKILIKKFPLIKPETIRKVVSNPKNRFVLLKDKDAEIHSILLYKVHKLNEVKTSSIEFLASVVKGGGTVVMRALEAKLTDLGCEDVFVQADRKCTVFYDKMHYSRLSVAKDINEKIAKKKLCFPVELYNVIKYWRSLKHDHC